MAKTLTKIRNENFNTIYDSNFKLLDSDFEYDYLKNLTRKLDIELSEFTQDSINMIVLWKVNRYAEIKESVLKKINTIKSTSNFLNVELTKEILEELLMEKGIQLPMASTILRFKNPEIYQILDQRVYRVLYNKSYSSSSKIQVQIELYLKYLSDLKLASNKLNISFHLSDRILYKVDKRVNKNIKLKSY